MKRLRPLSRSLALLAVTNMSLAPALAPLAFADMQAATTTDATLTDTATTTTETVTTTDGTTTTQTTTTTTVTTDNIADIIKSLTSSNIAEIQARYTELLDTIRMQKIELARLTDPTAIASMQAEITEMENLANAFKAILEGYEDSGAKTVTKTETYIDDETGDKVTRTTYSDGSYTETVDVNTDTDSDSAGFNDYSGSDSSSGGGSDFLQQMLQNPLVQGMIAGLLQKLMSGGLGSLSSLLGGSQQAGTQNGDTLLGKVCGTSGTPKCEASEYNTPSPKSKSTTETKEVAPNTSGSPDDRNSGSIQTNPTGINGRVPGRI